MRAAEVISEMKKDVVEELLANLNNDQHISWNHGSGAGSFPAHVMASAPPESEVEQSHGDHVAVKYENQDFSAPPPTAAGFAAR